jgi:hypothetical protein
MLISSRARLRNVSRAHSYRNRLARPLPGVTLFAERLRSRNSTKPARLPIRHDTRLLCGAEQILFYHLANRVLLPPVPDGYNAREGHATLGKYHSLTVAHPLHKTGEMLVCLVQINRRPFNPPCSHVTTLMAGPTADQLWLPLGLDSAGRCAKAAPPARNALVGGSMY